MYLVVTGRATSCATPFSGLINQTPTVRARNKFRYSIIRTGKSLLQKGKIYLATTFPNHQTYARSGRMQYAYISQPSRGYVRN